MGDKHDPFDPVRVESLAFNLDFDMAKDLIVCAEDTIALARKHGWDSAKVRDSSPVEYLNKLISEYEKEIDSRKVGRTCKNCEKIEYCATRRDGWELTGNSGHLDNDDLIFRAIANSCTIYRRDHTK